MDLAGGAARAERMRDAARAAQRELAAGECGRRPARRWRAEPAPPRWTAERRKAAAIGTSLTILALLLHVASVALRGVAVHRPPWSNMFEFSTAGADVGAVRFTEQYGLAQPVSAAVVADAVAAIAAELGRLDGRPRPQVVVAMGGAVTNLAAVRHGLTTYEPDVVHGTVLDRAEIDRQIDLYRSLDADGRRRIPGLQPARAEVILAGACIVRTIMDKLGCDTVTVSDRGLRHGVLHERFGPGASPRA